QKKEQQEHFKKKQAETSTVLPGSPKNLAQGSQSSRNAYFVEDIDAPSASPEEIQRFLQGQQAASQPPEGPDSLA
ncbi:MAG TPA: hypothetical protein VHV10_07080, partial [Ktedonobacteraceae bacterium]|nr:hypothetical protein [Ktedonobacteraceae bacterium]